ncbi:MAG: N-acetylmuramoyl-L-alanine amidase [Chlorobi bacterium]|nr:N-acetylmuramoyl-L-alanine amidase [Chlorobiota bacterium]
MYSSNKFFNYFKLIVFFIILIPVRFYADSIPHSKKNTKIIVIDPGHGGKDSGAMGKHGKEKDIVLSIALKLGKYIEDNLPDVKVIYTRKTDTFIELHKRAEIANSNKADLFVSIHVNSNKNTKPYGTETYAMGLHKTKGNLEVAKKENSVIMIEEDYTTKYEGFDPNSAESYIIFSLLQNVYLEQSLEFASLVQDEFRNRAKRYNRGIKQAGFLVLWKTTMPSVLVETGFISNSTEEKYLMSESGQNIIASAIYRAIKEYLVEQNSNGIENISKEVVNKSDTVTIGKQPEQKDKIVFCIQIASSSKPIDKKSDFFKGFKVEEHKITDTYKYTVEKNTDYNSVLNDLSIVRQKYPDAFIISFENDNKISLQEALKKINNK